MRRSEFHYDLPETLIAQHPLPGRSDSRLLVLEDDGSAPVDRVFTDLPGLLGPDDLLVFNDTRVIRARLLGRKATGGRVEVLVERVLDRERLLAQLRSSKPPRPGGTLVLEAGAELAVVRRHGELFELRLTEAPGGVEGLLERAGEVPLPPYIRRPAGEADVERYQTVYARAPGAVAAPTAGLHFDHPTLERLRAAGVRSAFVTLHVGAGTFAPMRVERLAAHRMHRERVRVGEEAAAAVAATRARGGRVVAVGTTTVRALESAAAGGGLAAWEGDTEIFISPGFPFRVVDALLTNFHLPESTLLMLVCAFGGRRAVLDAYAHAVSRGYRFFSYGDAMFLARRCASSC